MPLTQVSSRAIEDTLRYVLGASGTDHYTFTGKGLNGTVNDPTIYLVRGQTYIFENRSGGHPFYIKTSIANGGTNDAYNTGVTNNGGGNNTEIVFTVPHDAPDTLYYQCSSHSNMAGEFKIAGSVADGSITESKLADQAVSLSKLPHGTSSNDGKFLRANNGADPSFESVNTDLVSDTSPQLGGDLDTNGKNINFGHAGTHSDDTLRFGANGNDLYINHGGNAVISAETGDMYIRNTGTFSSSGARKIYIMGKVDEQSVTCHSDAQVELYHNNSKKYETTSYGTKVSGYQSSSGYVGFHVKGTSSDAGFGTNHGSSITSYDVSYYSPIPMFASKTIDHGSSYLAFPAYANGNYIKFTAPVAGLYMLELMASVETHHGGDWCAFGWEVNTTSNDSSSGFANNGRGICAVYERAGGDEGMGCHFSTTIWLDTNDYAVLYQQSTAAVRWKGNEYYVRGHLIH